MSAAPLAKFVLQPGICTRRYLWKIPAPGPRATQKDRNAYDEVCRRVGKDKVPFRSATNAARPGFATTDPVVATMLRQAIQAGNLKAREDISVMPMRCPHCDEWTSKSSTEADRQALYLHTLEKHLELLAGAEAAA